MKRLLAFGGLTVDPESIFAATRRFANVAIELLLDTDLGFREIIKFARVCRELRVASFTGSQNRNFFGSFYDPEFAPRHDPSLAHCREEA
jgi:hypothetical protein